MEPTMNVLLFGASGRIGTRIANELLERGHRVTGVSRSGEITEIDDPDLEVVTGDATDADDVARLAADHDAVASALGPSGDELGVLSEMASALVEGLGRVETDRLVWVGGAGGLSVGPDTRLVETDEFPTEAEPIARAHVDALEIIRDSDDLEWSYVAPAAVI